MAKKPRIEVRDYGFILAVSENSTITVDDYAYRHGWAKRGRKCYFVEQIAKLKMLGLVELIRPQSFHPPSEYELQLQAQNLVNDWYICQRTRKGTMVAKAITLFRENHKRSLPWLDRASGGRNDLLQ